MQTYGDYVGAGNGSSYPEVAANAVGVTSQQSPSPAYGYFRAPIQGIPHQRVYLFRTLDEAMGWFVALAHNPAQPYDYVAVFAAEDLSRPVPGLESFGHTMVGGLAQVGSAWPFLLGLPLGGLGGYFYRGWREAHPGGWIPGLPAASDHGPKVGGPWLDVDALSGNQPYVGGSWLDLVGPQVGGPWLDVDALSGNQPYVGGSWLDLVGPQVGGPWLDVDALSGNQSYVGGPWLDLVGPQVGGPWLDVDALSGNQPYVGGPWLYVVGPQVGGPWLDVDALSGNQPYVGGPWLDVVGPQVGGPWLDVDALSGNQPYVGGPWLDVVGPQVGGPWVDLIGAADAREQRRAWLQTRGLIESAKREVIDAQSRAPAAAWVWSFDASDTPPGRAMDLFSTQITPFSSVAQAQAYMYERLQMPHIALALFDTRATRHWPNPVRWNKSDDPSYEPLIAQRVAEYASTKRAGDYSRRGATSIGSALSDVRDRAQSIASKRAGDVVGVFHATKDKLWHALAFANEDDADDWLETQDPSSFTYAAYFNKNDAAWPQAVLEKIGGFRTPSKAKASIGEALDDPQGRAKIFAYAKALATGTPANAVGVVHLMDGNWSTFPFSTLDDAIDWLSSLTAHKERYSYAGAFDKAADGTAYVQQEEFGIRPVGKRSLAAMRGGYTWRAA